MSVSLLNHHYHDMGKHSLHLQYVLLHNANKAPLVHSLDFLQIILEYKIYYQIVIELKINPILIISKCRNEILIRSESTQFRIMVKYNFYVV